MYKDFTTINTTATDVNAIRQSIKNILLTRRGSLPGKPEFGSDLYKIVFSQIDNLTEMMAKNFILEALSKFETRIAVNEIIINRVEEYNRLVFSINFSYVDDDFNNIKDNVSIAFNL